MILQTLLLALNQVVVRFQGNVGNEYDDEYGQGLVEYALILVLVSVVVAALLTVFGPTLGNMFSNIVATVSNSQ